MGTQMKWNTIEISFESSPSITSSISPSVILNSPGCEAHSCTEQRISSPGEGREVFVIFHSERSQNPISPLPPGWGNRLGLLCGRLPGGLLLRAESISPARFLLVGGSAAASSGLQPIYGGTPWSLGVCIVFNH